MNSIKMHSCRVIDWSERACRLLSGRNARFKIRPLTGSDGCAIMDMQCSTFYH